MTIEITHFVPNYSLYLFRYLYINDFFMSSYIFMYDILTFDIDGTYYIVYTTVVQQYNDIIPAIGVILWWWGYHGV